MEPTHFQTCLSLSFSSLLLFDPEREHEYQQVEASINFLCTVHTCVYVNGVWIRVDVCIYPHIHSISFHSSSPTCLLHSSINPASPPAALAVLLALSPAYPPQPAAQPNHMTSTILLDDIEEGTCCYTLSKKYISYIRIYISIHSYLYTVVNNLSIYLSIYM